MVAFRSALQRPRSPSSSPAFASSSLALSLAFSSSLCVAFSSALSSSIFFWRSLIVLLYSYTPRASGPYSFSARRESPASAMEPGSPQATARLTVISLDSPGPSLSRSNTIRALIGSLTSPTYPLSNWMRPGCVTGSAATRYFGLPSPFTRAILATLEPSPNSKSYCGCFKLTNPRPPPRST